MDEVLQRRLDENLIMLIAAGNRWADLLRKTGATKSQLERELHRLETEGKIVKLERGQWAPVCAHCGTPFTLLLGVSRQHHNHDGTGPVLFHS
jgi:hypothetical protein